MPLFKVEIDKTTYYTIEEIEAENKDDALEIAREMIHDDSEDVIEDQATEEEYDVYELYD